LSFASFVAVAGSILITKKLNEDIADFRLPIADWLVIEKALSQ
jgi:hypothetical protein